MNFLKGYLTYIMAGIAVLWGLFGGLMGYITWDQALPIIWTGLSVFGIRRAIG